MWNFFLPSINSFNPGLDERLILAMMEWREVFLLKNLTLILFKLLTLESVGGWGDIAALSVPSQVHNCQRPY